LWSKQKARPKPENNQIIADNCKLQPILTSIKLFMRGG